MCFCWVYLIPYGKPALHNDAHSCRLGDIRILLYPHIGVVHLCLFFELEDLLGRKSMVFLKKFKLIRWYLKEFII